jgi:hypothetical protein
MRCMFGLLGACLIAATVSASIDPPVDVAGHARGATKVVVSTVLNVEAAFGVNDFGDQLILSKVSFRVEETLKGPHEATGVMTLEGGTVGDLTLEVSDMPRLEKGQRAVLFLTNSRGNGNVPHGRGAGVMRLDTNNRVVGTGLSLDDIRAAAKAAQAQER